MGLAVRVSLVDLPTTNSVWGDDHQLGELGVEPRTPILQYLGAVGF